VELVLTTGLKRSDLVGHLLKGSPIRHEVHSGFREAEFGEWEGKSWDEVQREYPDLVQIYKKDPIKLQFPNGEAMQGVHDRVMAAWNQILSRPEKILAIIGHSTTNTILLSTIKGKGFRELTLQVIGSFHEIHLIDGEIRIIRENVVVY
jgi:ribonuclease H / adenosylcobalamin/alpha-ribazole phosphatase